MNVVAEVEGFDPKSFTVMKLDLASFQSVRDFVTELNEFKAGKPLDRLVCNAAVYQPSLPEAKFTDDGFEQQLQINHLSHFLLSSLLVRMISFLTEIMNKSSSILTISSPLFLDS